MPFVLIPIYLFGGFVAFAAWCIYAPAMSFCVSIASRTTFLKSGPIGGYILVIGVATGALAGFLVYTVFVCALAKWVAGGWGACFAHSIAKQWGISLLPGIICGATATLFIAKSEA